MSYGLSLPCFTPRPNNGCGPLTGMARYLLSAIKLTYWASFKAVYKTSGTKMPIQSVVFF